MGPTTYDPGPRLCGQCRKAIYPIRRCHLDSNTGQEMESPYYTPESRYWHGMPDFWDVVFCGVECSVWWYKEKGIYPALTNSEKLC